MSYIERKVFRSTLLASQMVVDFPNNSLFFIPMRSFNWIFLGLAAAIAIADAPPPKELRTDRARWVLAKGQIRTAERGIAYGRNNPDAELAAEQFAGRGEAAFGRVFQGAIWRQLNQRKAIS